MANSLPSYSKVLNLGAPYTQNALVGDVIIQEKIDGSQLRWGFDKEGEFHVGSKGREIYSDNQEGMFAPAFKYLTEHFYASESSVTNCWYYGEYLQKPKHNCLKYERVPQNNIVLFDARLNDKWADRKTLADLSVFWSIDLIPEVFTGNVLDECAKVDKTPSEWLRELAESTNSYLGGVGVEGLVIKNYNQLIEVNGRIRHLTTKYVRAEFREKHRKANPSRREGIDDIILSLRSENRWEKAIQHLRDDGKLKNDVCDIGLVIKEVHRDLMEEEGDALKERIWDKYRKQVMSTAVRGLPDWYKDRLMEEQNGK